VAEFHSLTTLLPLFQPYSGRHGNGPLFEGRCILYRSAISLTGIDLILRAAAPPTSAHTGRRCRSPVLQA
jgi:hypothetical protein